MPVIRARDTAVHQMHGTTFHAYASPARGSSELCAWRIEVPAHSSGVAHRVTREEVLYILGGALRATIDGQPGDASAGDVVLVPAGSVLRIGNDTAEPAAAWVTTSAGLAAVLPDGSWVSPPWTR